MEKYFINIGRQLGSGGKWIGKMLAEELNIPIYDRTLIEMAAKESGFCKEIFEKNDEEKGLFRSLFDVIPFMSGNMYGSCLSEESLFKIQSDVIRNLSEKGSCIFVGRCADYILREEPRCINLFITADESDRIARIRDRKPELTEEQAKIVLQKADHKRSSYYNYYSGKVWGHSETYDLCINSSLLGLEGTKSFLRHFVQEFLQNLESERQK